MLSRNLSIKKRKSDKTFRMVSFLVATALLGTKSLTQQNQIPGLTLTAEKTDFKSTGSYHEMTDFCSVLDRASTKAKMVEFGESPQGRKMIGLVVSHDPDKAMNPKERTKPLVFVQCGIHSGEIEGKDALLMMARKMCLEPHSTEARVLEKVDLFIVPIFSVDAHERMSAFNRANQNGPTEMGWRVTAQNLNLNRDYVKAEALEMKHLLKMVTKLDPNFAIDNHTTDGGDWQYVVQYEVPHGPHLDEGLSDLSKKYVKEVMPQVDEDGYLTAPYFGGFSETNLNRGITIGSFGPRYSTGYYALRNIPSLLVETHVLKDYKTRLFATYALNLRTFQWCATHANELLSMKKTADERSSKELAAKELVMTSNTSRESREFIFKGFKRDDYQSEITGGMIRRWTDEKMDYPTVIRDQYVAGMSVRTPVAYYVPRDQVEVVELLEMNGIQYSKLSKEHVKKYKWPVKSFYNVRFSANPYEGRFLPNFSLVNTEREIQVQEGDLVVPVNQPLGRMVVHMFEPECPDSLVKWGFFNRYMEQKEYAEDYALEPIAKKMLESSPALKREFDELMKDENFARNPQAIMRFFYEQSPYFDQRFNICPVIALGETELNDLMQDE